MYYVENNSCFLCVGFINPGSLADRLSNEGPAQADNAHLMDRPEYLNDRTEGQSSLQPTGLTEEEQHPLSAPAHLSDRSTSFGLQPASGRPLRPESLAKTPLPTPIRVSDRGYVEPLLTTLL